MTTRYLRNPINQNLVREYDGAGNTVTSYTTEPEVYGDVVSQHRDSQDSVYHYDGQGSTLGLTDANGDVTATYSYSAFGDTIEQIGAGNSSFLYVGQKGYQVNEESRSYDVRRRTYAAQSGRWMSTDPVSQNGTSKIELCNRYEYVRQSPTNGIDPSGLCPACPVAWVAPVVKGVTWQYGCWCGKEPIPPRPIAAIPPPIDAIDACCQAHDICCGAALTNPARVACNTALCTCAKAALTGPCLTKAPDIKCCCQASRSVIALFCHPKVGSSFCN